MFRFSYVRLALAFLLGLVPAVAAAEGFGPFPVRNFQPIQQLILSMPGDRAAVLKPGALDLRVELADTASIYNDQGPQTQVKMKFETLRSGLFLRYGVTERLELAVEVPLLYRYKGLLEGAITGVERATTGLSPARNALQGTSYAFNASSNGRQIMNGTDGALGLGDSTLMGKYQVVSEGAMVPAISIRAAIKIPTGDESQFFGSGSPDFGFGLAAEKKVAGRWILYANLNGVVPTGSIAGFSLQPTISGMVATEYLWSENLSFTLHFDYYSTPFHGTGTQVFDKGVTEVAAGFSYRIRPHLLWQVYGVENVDFITGSAPDFTLSTVVTYRFDP